MNPEPHPHPITVRTGRVQECGEHLLARVRSAGKWHEVARLAPANPEDPEAGTFVVEYLHPGRLPQDVKRQRQVQESIRFYLIELAESAPWAYLCHHTTTTANVYDGESGGACWELIRAKP